MSRRKGRTLRILAISSGGGHWVQLRRMLPDFAGHELLFATVDENFRAEVAPARFHQIPDATRLNKLGLVRLALAVLWILVRERPDVVISTGAAPGYFALCFGHVLGARTIWIESIANAEELSLSGRKVRRFADVWLSQWPELARRVGAGYWGSVL